MSRAVPEWEASHDDQPIPPRNLCRVDGCGRRIDCHGLCARHARRMARHGDPLGGTTNRGACIGFLRDVVLPYRGPDCLQWPFGNNGKGYGVFHQAGRAIGVHTYVCERIHGPKPSPSHEVAHSCGNGHLLCCSPKHLRWATRAENHADKVVHGTSARGTANPASRLTPDEVRQIRSLVGSMSQRRIGAMFGVGQMTVSHIASRKTWGWLA